MDKNKRKPFNGNTIWLSMWICGEEILFAGSFHPVSFISK
jgi:hypothetical protein